MASVGTAALPAAAGNLRGIAAMTTAMASFIGNDTVMKLVSHELPVGEIIFIRNGIAALLMLCVVRLAAAPVCWSAIPWAHVGWRTLGEIGGTLLYIAALVRMPIADLTAIGQFMPLAVTAAAALFLGERVGWRRWLAALAGLAGVLIIVRPGGSTFQADSLLAMASLLFFVLRDLVTRRIAATVSTLHLTLFSAVSVWGVSLALLPVERWLLPTPRQIGLLSISAVLLLGGYSGIIVAMRSGEISAVTPFRYSVILWAILSGFLFWGHLPDPTTLFGIAVVVGAGLYSVNRERLRRRALQQFKRC